MASIAKIKNNGKRKGRPENGNCVFQRGPFFYVPVPADIFKRVIGAKGKFYWTELDGAVQLTSDPSHFSIPALVSPETAFKDQVDA